MFVKYHVYCGYVHALPVCCAAICACDTYRWRSFNKRYCLLSNALLKGAHTAAAHRHAMYAAVACSVQQQQQQQCGTE
jgi:hypothetical protein